MVTRVVYLVEDGKNVIKQHNIGPNFDAAALSRAIKEKFHKNTLPSIIIKYGTANTYDVTELYNLAHNQNPNQPHKVLFERKQIDWLCDIYDVLKRLAGCWSVPIGSRRSLYRYQKVDTYDNQDHEQ